MSVLEPPCLAIFDHDGVLVDSLALHQQSWIELGQATGLPITPEVVRQTFGMTLPAIIARLSGDSLSPAEVAEFGDRKEALYRDLARGNFGLMPGVHDLLDALSAAGVRLAIGSSAPRANLDLTVECCGLAGRFAAISSLEDVERGKPDPQVFLVAAQKAGVPAARSVVFEDAPVGIMGAKAAGMRAVGVTTTNPAADLFAAGADEVVDTLADYDVAGLLRHLENAKP